MDEIVTTKKASFLIADLFFEKDPTEIRADIVRYNFCARPVPGIRTLPHYTIVLDLTKTAEDLLANLKSTARYEIRRAEKDKFVCEFEERNCERLTDAFCTFYDEFAASRRLMPANRPRLRALAKAGLLEINRVRQEQGETLAWHVNGCVNGRHLHMYGCSFFRALSEASQRALVGRANRFLFWQEILRSKERDLKIFDFGGWYAGTEDHQQLQINQFKESFGGSVVPIYSAQYGNTLKGRLGLTYLQWKRRLVSGSPNRSAPCPMPSRLEMKVD